MQGPRVAISRASHEPDPHPARRRSSTLNAGLHSLQPVKGPDEHDSIQAVVDALSVAIRRPVLLDDPSLAPLAYSRQWGEIDDVRTRSILSRGAPTAVREALLAQGIAQATDVIHTKAALALGMEERVCLPIRAGRHLLGYIWVLDPKGTLHEAELDDVRAAARQLVALITGSGSQPVSDESVVMASLVSRNADERVSAAAALRARGALAKGPVVLCLLDSAQSEVDPMTIAHQVVRRLSLNQAIAGRLPDAAGVVVSTEDPIVRTAHTERLAQWLRMTAGIAVAVGQSAPAGLEELDEAARQARAALRVARSRPSGEPAVASWPNLGADRLVAQLPGSWRGDVPPSLVRLLDHEPVLASTLLAFLEAGGDVKATAEAMSLHRSGVYYRLRRVEELTGLRMSSGDDRLLAHLAIRAEHLF